MCIKYADDITLLHFIRDSCDVNLQAEFVNVLQWSAVICLPINKLKCCAMNVITKKHLSLPLITDFDGNALKCVKDVSILGVKLSSDLKWNMYFDIVVKKASKRMYPFYNLVRSGCPAHLFLQAYVAYVRSVLLYCYPVFLKRT